MADEKALPTDPPAPKPDMMDSKKAAALLAAVAGACGIAYTALTGEKLPAADCPEPVECPVCEEVEEPAAEIAPAAKESS